GRNAAFELLAADKASLLRDFLQANVLIANSCQYPALSDAAAKHVVEEAAAGDEGDDHHHADDEKNAAQHNFLDRAGRLQKSNHALGTPEWIAESSIIPARMRGAGSWLAASPAPRWREQKAYIMPSSTPA